MRFASAETGDLVYYLNPPGPGTGRPAWMGEGWLAVISPHGLPRSTVPTLVLHSLNEAKWNVPLGNWSGWVMKGVPGGG